MYRIVKAKKGFHATKMSTFWYEDKKLLEKIDESVHGFDLAIQAEPVILVDELEDISYMIPLSDIKVVAYEDDLDDEYLDWSDDCENEDEVNFNDFLLSRANK